jgi:hypothetical protein
VEQDRQTSRADAALHHPVTANGSRGHESNQIAWQQFATQQNLKMKSADAEKWTEHGVSAWIVFLHCQPLAAFDKHFREAGHLANQLA